MLRAELADALRALGHDVVRATEAGLSRADDAEILHHAVADGRILLTLDGHFGNYAVLPLARHCGVIRLRVHPTTTENVLRLLRPFLTQAAGASFENQLVIVTPARVRWVRTGS